MSEANVNSGPASGTAARALVEFERRVAGVGAVSVRAR